jgi:hypothetical protein
LNDPKEGSQVELNFLVSKTEFPQFPYAAATPPADRTYLLFPKELVWTNVVKLVLSSFLQLEAFVFPLDEFMLEGDGGYSFGMVNAFLVRYRLGCNQAHWAPLPSFVDSDFKAFPHIHCCSKGAWDKLLCLSWLISMELSWSSIGQSTRQTKIIDYSIAEWSYLSYRLLGDANKKEGVSTNLFPRKNGTKEIIKVRLTKFTHLIDTLT